MTDVEIISRLCEIDSAIREFKAMMNRCATMVRSSGITKLPPYLANQVPDMLNDIKRMLATKRNLRVQLWKEHHIFYWSDV